MSESLLSDLLIAVVFVCCVIGCMADYQRRHDRRVRQRRENGLCPRCGSSLVGNVSGVCPECGTHVGKTG